MGEKQASGNNENGKGKQTSKKHEEATADKTAKLGVLGRMVANACRPNFSSPPLTTQQPPPPHEQNQGKTKPPDVFFADDPRMEWLPTYVIGKTQDIVSHVNHWIKTGQLPQTFTQIDLLALVYRGAQGIRQSWFTPRAIYDAVKKHDVKRGTNELKIADIIGADSWNEIEIQISGRGIRARKSGADKWYPENAWIEWETLNMRPSSQTRYFSIFKELARMGGTIPKKDGTDYNSAVHDLNSKLRAAFGLKGQAFKTQGALTKTTLATISVKK